MRQRTVMACVRSVHLVTGRTIFRGRFYGLHRTQLVSNSGMRDSSLLGQAYGRRGEETLSVSDCPGPFAIAPSLRHLWRTITLTESDGYIVGTLTP